MATLPIQLFFKGNREYGVGTIKFDLILSETHNFNNTITSHDVEDGSQITDHIRNELLNGSLTGLITNYSIKTFFNITNRAQDAFDELERLWQSKELVTIVTVMRVYENVAITSVSISRSADTGQAISMDISFRQVKTVKLKEVQIDLGVNITDTKTDLSKQASPPADLSRTTEVVQ